MALHPVRTGGAPVRDRLPAGPRHLTRRTCGLGPHTEDGPWLEQTALQLLDEHRALGRRPLAAHHALRRSLLEALLLRLAHSPGVSDPPDAGTNFHGNSPNSASPPGTGARLPVYERFLDALELHFRELYRADDYAQLLGCSVRTISRAARAATGKGAREIINERRLLEARRLLSHTRWTAPRSPPISASPTRLTLAASSATTPASHPPPT